MPEIVLTDRRGHVQQAEAGGYDAAKNSPSRSTLFIPSNSRRELNSLTRKELCLKVRALDANLGIYGRIIQKARQHSVGKGIFPRPATRDLPWNDVTRKLFEEWGGHSGVYSIDDSRDIWEDQGHVAEGLVGDGEFLEAMVRAPFSRAPMVQPLDVFEVEQPPFSPGQTGTWEDGVRLNEFMRPVEYAVRELPGPREYRKAFRTVPRGSMIHVFRRRRAKQVRGLTWFYSAINQGVDALDLRALETGTAKLHSALGVIVKKKAGEAGKSGVTGNVEKLIGDGQKITQINENFIRGAAIEYLASDEGIELVHSDRPSVNLLTFLEFLYRDIAIATGLPLEVVYNMADLGGASARAVLEDAQWWFEMIQDKIVERHSRRLYVWRIAIAMNSGEIPLCKDPEWWACAWRGPAKLTVDLGRTAEANIKLVKNGMLSLDRYYDERSLDAKAELSAHMDLLQWLKRECETRGLDPREVIEASGSVSVNIGGPGDNGGRDE